MSWDPTSITREDWGRLQILIGGLDVTYFRGIPVQVSSWSSGEPFGDASATLTLPQVTPYERLGVQDLWWLYEWSNIEINLVDDTGIATGDFLPLWEGMIASFDDELTAEGAALTVECIGALYQLDLYVAPPRHLRGEGQWAVKTFRDNFRHINRPHLRTKELKVEFPDWWGGADDPNADDHVDAKGNNVTGFKSPDSGSWNNVLTGFLQEQLGMMQEKDSNHGQLRWTVEHDRDRFTSRQPVLRLKDRETTHWSITAGTPGVEHDLTMDMTQAPNTFYGEGTDDAGTKWRNSYDVGRYKPLAIDPRVDPSVDNTVDEVDHDKNPHLDESWVRHEVHNNYGTGVSLLNAMRSAGRRLDRDGDPGWAGRLTLSIDPEEGSRFEMRAGQNLLFRHYRNFNPKPSVSWDELTALGIVDGSNRYKVAQRGAAAAIVRRTLDYLHDEGLVPALPTPTQDHFSDDDGHTFEDDINHLAEAGITFGFDDGTYRPGEDMTRQAMVAFATRSIEWATGEELAYYRDHFPDDDGSFFEEDINKAAENGFVVGYKWGFFGPNDGAQRIALTIVMQRMMRYFGDDTGRDQEGLHLHIAEADIDLDALTVTLTVDTKARDLLTLAEMLERRAQNNRTATRMLRAGAESGITSDDRAPWDIEAGAGFIPRKSKTMQSNGIATTESGFTPADAPDLYVHVNADAGTPYKRWGFTPMLAQEYGNIYKVRITAYDINGNVAPAPFHVGVYGEWLDGSMNVDYMGLDSNGEPNPFTEGYFDIPGNIDSSRVILWGQFGQRAGYWPGVESDGDPVTGVLVDEGGFNYTLPDGEMRMWIAIYCEHTEDVYFQGRMRRGND